MPSANIHSCVAFSGCCHPHKPSSNEHVKENTPIREREKVPLKHTIFSASAGLMQCQEKSSKIKKFRPQLKNQPTFIFTLLVDISEF